MKKILALIVAVIMVFTVVACGGNNTQNSSGDNSDTGSNNPISSPIGELSSNFGGNSSSQDNNSSSETGGSSSSGNGQTDVPTPTVADFDRISNMEGNIFSLTFDDGTVFTPLYADDVTPGTWDKSTAKGLYQNFSVKSNEGSPKTNYVSVKNGVAELIDESNGGTKVIIDFGDQDIDNGAIEGCFEFKMLDLGPSWTPIQFYGTSGQRVNAEIFAIRTSTMALSSTEVEAGVRVSGGKAQNATMIFKKDYTYSVYFDFNMLYGRFTLKVNCVNKPYDKEYVYIMDTDIASVQGICFSTSDSGTRRGSVDNFALSTHSGTEVFTDELKSYAEKYEYFANGNEQLLNGVNQKLTDFSNKILSCNQAASANQLLEQYRQEIYSLYEASCKDFSLHATMSEFVEHFLDTTPSYRPSWASEGFKNRWNYIDGVFLEGLVQNYERTQFKEYKDFFINFINYYVYEEGQGLDEKFRKPNASASGSAYNGTELDSVCESRILFDAYDYTGDRRYLEAIDYTYQTLKTLVPKAGDSGCYSHKYNYLGQVWLDGFYMYAPFTIRYANLKGDTALINELTNQYRFVYSNMRDDKGLYRHGMDVTKSQSWADKQTGLSQSVWLRAEGWLLASLVDCLEYYPEGENKEFLKKMFSEAMASVVKFRDEKTAMYYNVVDFDPTVDLGGGTYNYLETSGSSLVAYACMKGARLGVLAESYYDLGESTFKGVYNNKLTKNADGYVLSDIILSAGLGSDRNGTPRYYMNEKICQNDGKGVGPFMMAYNEFALYNTKTE